MNTNIQKNVQLVLRLYSLPSFSLIHSDTIVFNKISSHVCIDDRPFIDRIELKLIFSDYQGNLWYLDYVKKDHWWHIFICRFRFPSREAEYLRNCRGSTCEVFHHNMPSCVYSNHEFQRLHSCTDCICCAVRHSVFSDDFAND